MRGLSCKRVQCDEIWSFCYAKDKNVPADKQGKFGFGSVWTWTAIDADTKLIPSFTVGNRDAASARILIEDLASRLKTRIQFTTDGLRVYALMPLKIPLAVRSIMQCSSRLMNQATGRNSLQSSCLHLLRAQSL